MPGSVSSCSLLAELMSISSGLSEDFCCGKVGGVVGYDAPVMDGNTEFQLSVITFGELS